MKPRSPACLLPFLSSSLGCDLCLTGISIRPVANPNLGVAPYPCHPFRIWVCQVYLLQRIICLLLPTPAAPLGSSACSRTAPWTPTSACSLVQRPWNTRTRITTRPLARFLLISGERPRRLLAHSVFSLRPLLGPPHQPPSARYSGRTGLLPGQQTLAGAAASFPSALLCWPPASLNYGPSSPLSTETERRWSRLTLTLGQVPFSSLLITRVPRSISFATVLIPVRVCLHSPKTLSSLKLGLTLVSAGNPCDMFVNTHLGLDAVAFFSWSRSCPCGGIMKADTPHALCRLEWGPASVGGNEESGHTARTLQTGVGPSQRGGE